MIPITSVDVSGAEPFVLEVLRSGMLAQGPMVRRLEDQFADLTGVRHAVAVNNGTTALVASLQVLDLEPGDEVLTSPFTFVATLNAILEAGATARFADIRVEDFGLDPQAVEGAIGERTKVLMPVHLYGQTADMTHMLTLAQRHGLRVVEDAAQAHLASQDGRRAGAFGDLGCFSFYATKNLTTGEGGIITTDNDDLAGRLRVLRNQGMRERYQYELAGHNYRMTDLQAAVAMPQLERVGALTAARQANAARLSAGLAGVTGLRTPRQLDGREHVWHQYTVLLTPDAGIKQKDLVAGLTERGVGCGIYYPKLVFDYDCYRSHPRVVPAELPIASQVAGNVVSLPVHPALTSSNIDDIVAAVREVMAG